MHISCPLVATIAATSLLPAFAGDVFYEPTQIIFPPEGDIAQAEEFGSQLAFSGQTLIVGDPEQRSADFQFDGAAFVYRLSGGGWILEETFRQEDLSGFGQDVASSGDTVAISAEARSIPVDITLPSGEIVPGSRRVAGEVLVYTRTADGIWTGPEQVRPANSEDAVFGTAIAIQGDTLAMNNRILGSESWTVTLFERSGGTWTELQTLEDPQARRGGLGGGSSTMGALAFAGSDTLVIGSDGFGEERADVFIRNAEGMWQFQQELEPSEEIRAGTQFGSAIAASPDRIAVASPRSEEIFVFEKAATGDTWGVGTRVTPQDGELGDRFGTSLAIAGDCLAVGAPFEDSSGSLNNRNATDNSFSGSGAVYLFSPGEIDGSWNQTQLLKTPTNENAGLAVAIAPESGTVFLGGESDVFVQVPGPERAYTELEVAVFSPDLDSPIAGPVLFGFGEPFPIALSFFTVETTATGFSLATTQSGRFNQGECACVRLRDLDGQLPEITGFTLTENSSITGFTAENISFSADEIIINPVGLEFVPGRTAVQLQFAQSSMPPQVTSVERTPEGIRIAFTGTPGITDWQFAGGSGLETFSGAALSLQNLTEPSPGSYLAELQISGTPSSFFVRVAERGDTAFGN